MLTTYEICTPGRARKEGAGMKVWILEGFIDAAHMQETLKQNEQMLEWAKETRSPEDVKMAKQMLDAYKKTIAENPDGYWLGYEGKIDYKTFCRMAQETLRWGKENGMRFRVLKADLRDEKAKSWMNNYENGVENAGVLRYLYATL